MVFRLTSAALVLDASAKLSTRFPPEGLVELPDSTKDPEIVWGMLPSIKRIKIGKSQKYNIS